ncbi:MAG: DUF1801 domain-containing protein [Kofleriaceae bacterium]
MARIDADTVEDYLAKLPADRRAALSRVRAIVNENLPPGFEEGIQYGAITWYVPLSRYPVTYNGQPLALASLASQKNYMALYLMCVYGDAELERWFRAAYRAAGKKLDMGKACVRFDRIEALLLEVVGEAIRKVSVDAYIERYEQARAGTKTGQKEAKRAAVKAAKAAAKPAAKMAKTTAAAPAAKVATKPAAKKPAARAEKAVKKPAAKAAKAVKKPAAKEPSAKAAKAVKKPAKAAKAVKKPATKASRAARR